jgi:hypothetical protein
MFHDVNAYIPYFKIDNNHQHDMNNLTFDNPKSIILISTGSLALLGIRLKRRFYIHIDSSWNKNTARSCVRLEHTIFIQYNNTS